MVAMRFHELDVVRLCRLLAATRHVTGTEGVVRQPRVGDVGAIVHVLAENAFIVECVDSDGRTTWLADFVAEELEIVSPAGERPS
jgi:Domain of unknown function (DUF4926)